MRTRGGRGSKNPKILRTSYMDGPKCEMVLDCRKYEQYQRWDHINILPALVCSDPNCVEPPLQPHPPLTTTTPTTTSHTTRRRRISGARPGSNWGSLRPDPTISCTTRSRRRHLCITGSNISRRSRRLFRRRPCRPSGSSAAYAPFKWVNCLPFVFTPCTTVERSSKFGERIFVIFDSGGQTKH